MAPRGRFNKNRGRGGGRGRGRGRGGGGGQRTFEDNRQSFRDIDKKNEKFEGYYNTINIVPAGDQRDAFWAALRRELPNSFRFTGSKGHALAVRNNLVERFFPVISQIKHDDRPVELPKEIPWFPDGLAYSMATPKNIVRKYEPSKEFQKFLVSETGVGNISRQEHVSMIPPLLLDISPEHTVLDLCAAPGSKSAQLIEAIHAGEEGRVAKAIQAARSRTTANGSTVDAATEIDSGRATGLLVANDVNYQRAQMLVHQVKRLNSPNLIVTNHDATMFPSIELPIPGRLPDQPRRYLKFDRILADVPCSGDGTPRKNPAIWKDWSPQNGLGLYITQVRILTRSLQMLKQGGRVVYSTCSMNPVENEAVVASAIERCGGVAKVRLVDSSDRLPELVRSPGLTDWSIMSRNGQIYESYPEAVQYEPEGSKVVPGMFAPEAQEQIPLQHCMRVYPHQQDTGGFFIAVLEKLSEIKAKPESESKSANKEWTFDAPPHRTEEVQNTFMGGLLDEIENPQPPIRTDGDLPSAAMVQNAEISSDSGGAHKRKASEQDGVNDGASAKKVKLAGSDAHGNPIAAPSEHLPLPSMVEMASSVGHDGDASIDTPADVSTPFEVQPLQHKRRRDDNAPNEESFIYLSATHPELKTIYKFYELHEDFPRDRFLVRNPAGDPVKGIYYTSQLVKDILTTNDARGMKFVHAGVKMFMKQDAQGQDICRWRIQLEGLPIIEGWVGEERVIRLRKRATLRKLLVEMFPKIGSRDATPGAESWRDLGEIGEQVLNMSMGCCVLRVQPSDDEDGFPDELTLPLWRSLHSLNLMLPKEDRKAMLLRLFNEDVELINHSDPKQGRATGPRAAVNSSETTLIENGTNGEHSLEGTTDQTTSDAIAGAVADQDDLAAQDSERALEMEVLEDDDTKIAAAMLERAGESDEMNTTV